jgi:hypothetical protein
MVQDVFRRKIVHSIDNKRPVISYGIIGAPDEGVVAGYDQNGKVLLGGVFFITASKGNR